MSCLMSYLKHQHITFGVKPTEASSKYGYVKLKTSKSIDDMFYQPSISDKNKHKILFDCYEVESFFEKPDFNEACYFLQTRQYLWNSGMYIFDIKTLQQEMKKLHPDVFDAVVEHFFAYNSEVIIADENILKQIPNLSVDNAVSIYSKNLNCCCAKFDWQDIGHLDNLMMMLVYNKIDVDAVLRCYQKSSSKVVSL